MKEDIKKLFTKAKTLATAIYSGNGNKDFNSVYINEDGSVEVEFCYYSCGDLEHVYILLTEDDMSGSIEEVVNRQNKKNEEALVQKEAQELAIEKERAAIEELREIAIYQKLKAKYDIK